MHCILQQVHHVTHNARTHRSASNTSAAIRVLSLWSTFSGFPIRNFSFQRPGNRPQDRRTARRTYDVSQTIQLLEHTLREDEHTLREDAESF